MVFTVTMVTDWQLQYRKGLISMGLEGIEQENQVSPCVSYVGGGGCKTPFQFVFLLKIHVYKRVRICLWVIYPFSADVSTFCIFGFTPCSL